uniref:Uncharacterized protein n=1 Tax=uncultured Thiotrichaceae bacterium TaxID=298394 RepID=A0A6S6UF81_9GAMM|nr:MAG: Unknown protein [uncultured Thiotrichaceae bacterium]
MSSDSNNDNPLEFSAAPDSREFLQDELNKRQKKLMSLTPASDPLERAGLQYDVAEIMLELAGKGMPEAAWGLSKEAFTVYRDAEQWDDAIRCCDVLFRTELPAAVPALGNGLWLSITYPVDPELTILMLNNLIDTTPDNADGAAVAAVVAHYIADLRLEGDKRESVMFLTSALLGKVAERHSQIDSQDKMNMWMQKLDLLDPAVFMPRMAQVIDAIVEGQWWYDRDELRARLPVN